MEILRIRNRVRYRQTLIEMQFARPPIVVEAIGYVAVLLDFDQADPGPDSVDGIRRNIEEIARLHRMPLKQTFDRAIERSLAQLLPINPLAKSDRELCVRLGIDDQPAFF